jgi:hypothetical protein
MVEQAEPGHEIEALIHPGSDGNFWGEVVGLAGCYTQGDNYSKILARLRDAHELCSRSPGPPPAPSTPITLGDGASVGDLISLLKSAGWREADEASESHLLLEHGASGSKLCVPSDLAELIHSGLRAAITNYLAG